MSGAALSSSNQNEPSASLRARACNGSGAHQSAQEPPQMGPRFHNALGPHAVTKKQPNPRASRPFLRTVSPSASAQVRTFSLGEQQLELRRALLPITSRSSTPLPHCWIGRPVSQSGQPIHIGVHCTSHTQHCIKARSHTFRSTQSNRPNPLIETHCFEWCGPGPQP